jgi:hypothetical protein
LTGARTLLLRVLTQSSYIQLNKTLIRSLGLEKAAVLSDMIHFDAYLKEQNKDDDGWFYYTYADLNQALCISRDLLIKHTKELEDLKIIASKKYGVPCRKYYKINYDLISLIIVEIPQELKFSTTGDRVLRPLAVVELDHLINNIINTNNKYNNIEFLEDSNESLKTKEAKASLNNLSNIKKIISPIEKNKEFMEILGLWNALPIASKHTRLDTKTVSDAFLWFNRLKDGTYCQHASAVTADWLIQIGLSLDWKSKKFSFTEIKEGVERLGLQYQEGYWPHTIEEKKKMLPKSLTAAFYSPYNKNCPSPFLKVLANEPIKQGQLSEVEENSYQKYIDIYKKVLTIKDNDISKLIKYIKAILNVHKSVTNTNIKSDNFSLNRATIENELGTNFSSIVGDENTPEYLIEQHANYIYECQQEWKKFKLTPVSFSPHGKLWDLFLTWLEEKKGIKLWLDNDEIDYLALRYDNYRREKNKKEKDKPKKIKNKIEELKQLIEKETSDDIKMLFEEELERLENEMKNNKEAV